ncbi:hypothetical protein JTE90_026312 [Oedothorax gibbosus]|uniref:Uncharacterized protein n=1 Tax=Oedothorax gibbosus TaxID=931172 RepID=A0AAV6U4J5_9ARAC|nr:hypothetical protein JTE90_026312 [Oedothorax gibbosus]
MDEEDRDIHAEKFSEALFTYLWFTENLVSCSTAAETLGDMSDIVTEAAKAVVVLSALTLPHFNMSMGDFFRRNEMNRRNVFTFISVYCFNHHEANDDVFAVVLNTCTFIYRLVMFLLNRGHIQYVKMAAMCWNELYENNIKEHFCDMGGWEAFRSYLQDRRYIFDGEEADQNLYSQFLSDINYLFPKLDECGQNSYPFVFSPAAAIAEIEAATMVSLLNSKQLQPEDQCFNEQPMSDVVPDIVPETAAVIPEPQNPTIDSTFEEIAECIAVLAAQQKNGNVSGAMVPHTPNLNEDANYPETPDSDDSEESEADLIAEACRYVSQAKNWISDLCDDSDEELFQELVRFGLDSINKLQTEAPALGCMACENDNSARTVSPDDQMCLKHHPDSFYCIVTNPETENLCEAD